MVCIGIGLICYLGNRCIRLFVVLCWVVMMLGSYSVFLCVVVGLVLIVGVVFVVGCCCLCY